MSRWTDYWYGPVAAIRPYLFLKCFLLLVGADVVLLMTARGARYGLDGFSVAHFQWLDAIHPTPGAAWYVFILTLVSLFAFYLTVTPSNRFALAALALLYTYSWAMSRQDGFMHHYMTSIILFLLVFFPKIEAEDLYSCFFREPCNSGNKRMREKSERNQRYRGWWYTAAILIGALVYRLNETFAASWLAMIAFAVYAVVCTAVYARPGVPASPRTCAWAYRLLGTSVGLIYVFTSLAKCDLEWIRGHTLRSFEAANYLLGPLEEYAAGFGIPSDWFWSILATSAIPVELTIAISYFLAVRQDEGNAKWLRIWSPLAFLLAIALHVNNELMNLSIQWFGYYMMFLAVFFFLPSRALMSFGTVVFWPAHTYSQLISHTVPTGSPRRATTATFLPATLAVAFLALVGLISQIPGVGEACALVGAIGGAWAVMLGMRNRLMQATQVCGGLASAALLVLACYSLGSTRFDYYDIRGRTLQRLDKHADAVAAFEAAKVFADSNATETADMYVNLGLGYRRLGRQADAISHYRHAISIFPGHFLAHYNLATLYFMDLQELDLAISHYRHALAIKPDLSDAHINLGLIMLQRNEAQLAANHFRVALDIEPEAEDARKFLDSALTQIGSSKSGRDAGSTEKSTRSPVIKVQ